jgi:hypothetical protein
VVDRFLAQLLIGTPATPAIRAAAFKALARMPDVRLGGRVRTDQGWEGTAIVVGSMDFRLVIGSGTSQVELEGTGGARSLSSHIEGGWTDGSPHIPAL